MRCSRDLRSRRRVCPQPADLRCPLRQRYRSQSQDCLRDLWLNGGFARFSTRPCSGAGRDAPQAWSCVGSPSAITTAQGIDGIPFYDTNSPMHHSWAFVPAQFFGGIDLDRSPGTASTVGPTPFGGSIHLTMSRAADVWRPSS